MRLCVRVCVFCLSAFIETTAHLYANSQHNMAHCHFHSLMAAHSLISQNAAPHTRRHTHTHTQLCCQIAAEGAALHSFP